MLNLGTVLRAVLYADNSQTYVLGFDLSPKTNYTCKYNSLTFIFRRLIDIFGLIWPKKNSSLLKCLTQEKKKKKKKKFLLRLQHANLPAAPMQPRATTNLGIPDPSPSPPAPHLQHCWLHFQDMFPVSLSPLLSLSCQSLSLFLSHLDHSSSDLFRFCHFSA